MSLDENTVAVIHTVEDGHFKRRQEGTPLSATAVNWNSGVRYMSFFLRKKRNSSTIPNGIIYLDFAVLSLFISTFLIDVSNGNTVTQDGAKTAESSRQRGRAAAAFASRRLNSRACRRRAAISRDLATHCYAPIATRPYSSSRKGCWTYTNFYAGHDSYTCNWCSRPCRTGIGASYGNFKSHFTYF